MRKNFEERCQELPVLSVCISLQYWDTTRLHHHFLPLMLLESVKEMNVLFIG